MKVRYIKILAVSMLLSACKDNELFEKEMYRNEVALISNNYYNTFQEVVDLTNEEVTGYITASTGGTHAPTINLAIQLEEDQTQFDIYNRSLFDNDEKLYAKLLPRDKYEIVNNYISIEAGTRTGRTSVKIRPAGLSPDSTYLIGLQATAAPGIDINPKKKNILYQVLIKNAYASQAENAFYAMSGLVNGMVTAGNKKLFPLTGNSVRVIAGIESFESKADLINATSILLEVGTDNHVTIKPYRNIKVTQIDGDSRYPNEFRIEEYFGRQFNVFLLSYSYELKGVTRQMQEELRIEIKR
ncbi:hypothetical protein KO02_22015 [Sphingobacterium sp. ML3W]|uniref:BT_3044 domain-containing protein n=1 Tax=Sphingobacterium sp. ML3W TaxID=1538644 RepID=UPI0004F66374|nr:DUF4361 domain-containing protein [Sphingobacterium sp. ML3W]AIM39061.1 hypothetical protein KO02_22015 [Sphingobacterium sp. ML3W]